MARVRADRRGQVESDGARPAQWGRYLPIAEHGLIGDLHTVALVFETGDAYYAWPHANPLRRHRGGRVQPCTELRQTLEVVTKNMEAAGGSPPPDVPAVGRSIASRCAAGHRDDGPSVLACAGCNCVGRWSAHARRPRSRVAPALAGRAPGGRAALQRDRVGRVRRPGRDGDLEHPRDPARLVELVWDHVDHQARCGSDLRTHSRVTRPGQVHRRSRGLRRALRSERARGAVPRRPALGLSSDRPGIATPSHNARHDR
jgi:hypothetical protein